jgi:hypothetical protein
MWSLIRLCARTCQQSDVATVSVSSRADYDNGGRGLPRGVMGGPIATEPNHWWAHRSRRLLKKL